MGEFMEHLVSIAAAHQDELAAAEVAVAKATALSARYCQERDGQGEELRAPRREREEWRSRSGYGPDRRDRGSSKRKRSEWEVEPYMPAADDRTGGMATRGLGGSRAYGGGGSAYGVGSRTYAFGGPGSSYDGGSAVRSGYNGRGGNVGGTPGGYGSRDMKVSADLLARLTSMDPYKRDAAQAELTALRK